MSYSRKLVNWKTVCAEDVKRAWELKSKLRGALALKLGMLQQDGALGYEPYGKQRDFHAVGARRKERLFLAGNRCGKTFCGAIEMAYHLTGRYPDWWDGVRFDVPVRAWAASVTAEVTRDVLQLIYLGDDASGAVGVIPEYLVAERSMRRGVSGAVDVVKIRHVSGGYSVLGFKSYDQGREKFQGTSRHLVHLDEEPEIDIYEECLLRTLDVGGHVMLTMTPLKGMTELCGRFLEGKTADGVAVVQASWDDTEHLGEEEKARLRAGLRPHEIEAREKGIPVLVGGRVYPVLESEIAIKRFELPKHFKRVAGLDFGWRNPTACVWTAYDTEEDIIYVYDVYAESEKAPVEHVGELERYGAKMPFVCDPAGLGASQADGRSLVEHYGSLGLMLTQADNSIEAGVMQLLERMRDGRLKVFDDLDAWWKEFRLYRRDDNGRIVKKHDHLMDATRYVVMSGLPLAVSGEKRGEWRRGSCDWTVV